MQFVTFVETNTVSSLLPEDAGVWPSEVRILYINFCIRPLSYLDTLLFGCVCACNFRPFRKKS